MPRGVGDHGLGREALDQRPRDAGVDRRDQADPERGEARGQQRHGDPQRRAAAERAGELVDHAAVGGDVGAADLDLAVDRQRRGRRRRRGRRPRRRSRSAGCGCATQRGRDHHRQAPDQVEDGAERLAAGADHRGGAEVGDRDLASAQGFGGRVAAVEVLRPLPQPAEVDDPLDPGAPPRRRRSSRAPAWSRSAKSPSAPRPIEWTR